MVPPASQTIPGPVDRSQLQAYPAGAPASRHLRVRFNGVEGFVWQTKVAAFATLEFTGPVRIEVDFPETWPAPTVRPLSRGIEISTGRGTAMFTLTAARDVSVDFGFGHTPLYVYATAAGADAARPLHGAAGVHYFEAGRVHEVGRLELKSGEEVYIEAGAVVRGCIRAINTKGVRIRGRGVLDGSFYNRGKDGTRSIVIEGSEDTLVEDIVMVEPSGWMLVVAASRGVTVRRVRMIGIHVATDGVDIVGSSDVTVEDCFLRNNDDCVAIKSGTYWIKEPRECTMLWNRPVENILVRGCILANDPAGNVVEIGHELSTSHVRGVVFRDCDVLHCHGNGAVFAIHNCDAADVSDVLYEDIRVEHYWDKLFDVRVMFSMWGRDVTRGRVRNVTFRNIRVAHPSCNSGYSLSVVGGWDAMHPVENVVFEDIYLNERKMTSFDGEMEIFTRHVHDMVIR
jgi:polygalacturonase